MDARALLLSRIQFAFTVPFHVIFPVPSGSRHGSPFWKSAAPGEYLAPPSGKSAGECVRG
jgi:hypothetical protein